MNDAAFFLLFRLFHGEGNALFCRVNRQHPHSYDIPHFKHIKRMPDKSVRYLRNVNKPVLMNAYIHKRAEINYVSYGALQLHPGFQILHAHNICSEHRRWQCIARISAGLTDLGNNIVQRWLPCLQFIGKCLHAAFFDRFGYTGYISVSYVIGRYAAKLKQTCRDLV